MTSPFDFSDCRAFLKAYLKSLPKGGHGEARRIAEYLHVSSTFISQVLSGDRHLTPEHAQALAEYFGLAEIESDYLFYLVQLDRAGSEKLKAYLSTKLRKIKSRSLELADRVKPERRFSTEEKSVFYSSTLYSAIHLYTSTSPQGRTLDDIADRFGISHTKAVEIIRFLKDAKLVVEKKGYYTMGVQSTHVERGSPHLLKHHSNWRIKAIQASEKLSAQELMYSGQVSLSEKDFVILRTEMTKFIETFLKTVHESPAEEIACLNLDWFWIRG